MTSNDQLMDYLKAMKAELNGKLDQITTRLDAAGLGKQKKAQPDGQQGQKKKGEEKPKPMCPVSASPHILVDNALMQWILLTGAEDMGQVSLFADRGTLSWPGRKPVKTIKCLKAEVTVEFKTQLDDMLQAGDVIRVKNVTPLHEEEMGTNEGIYADLQLTVCSWKDLVKIESRAYKFHSSYVIRTTFYFLVNEFNLKIAFSNKIRAELAKYFHLFSNPEKVEHSYSKCLPRREEISINWIEYTNVSSMRLNLHTGPTDSPRSQCKIQVQLKETMVDQSEQEEYFQ